MLRRLMLMLSFSMFSAFFLAEEQPHIGFVYPAGGKQGTIFEVMVGGKYLSDVLSANITGGRVVVQVLEDPDKELDAKEIEDEKSGLTLLKKPQVLKSMLTKGSLKFDEEIAKKEKAKAEREKKRKNRKKKKDQFPDTAYLRVAIMDDALPGDREIRVITRGGLSNKFNFQVGSIPESLETEPNNRKDQINEVTSLPAIVNGQIMEGDVDVFRFTAKKGQALVVKADARKLLPYIADAVPGWFQPTIALYDKKGNELAHADSFYFSQDPVLFYDITEDSEYLVEIRDSIYRGREDFVYRLSIGELPFITRISPLGASYESSAVVSIFGKNLSVPCINICGTNRRMPVQHIQLKSKEGILTERVPFAFSELPEVNEKILGVDEKIQEVKIPVVINGAIDFPGNKDSYSFSGKAGQKIAIEVTARRLGSPMDSYIILYNSKGEKIAENDEDPTYQWDDIITHHADSGLMLTLPKNDTYTVSIFDLQGKGGEKYAYRLRISEPMPDFILYSIPPSVTVPRGGTGYFKVHAIRKDGFTGPIKISLNNNSRGFKLSSSVMPEGSDDIKLTVSASYEMGAGVTVCDLEGSAQVNSRIVTRTITPAEEYTQAFAYKHLVHSGEQLLLIAPPDPFSLSFSVDSNDILELTQGKETKLRVEVSRRDGFEENIRLQLVDPPEGVTLRTRNIKADKDKQPGGKGNKTPVVIRAESKAKPGTLVNLVMSGTTRVPTGKIGPKGKEIMETYTAFAPAIPVYIMKGKEEKQKKEEQEKPGEIKKEITEQAKPAPGKTDVTKETFKENNK
ncbi:MAG: PPC domain-containing protein [Candidatus Firestonebacteria bacterium]|nr:PPC domain-containing protein [Candidatus Firestonebacteria bacterium]